MIGPAAVALLLGVLACAALPVLPDPYAIQFIPLLLFVALVHPPARLMALCACGFLWALLRAGWLLTDVLPAELEGQDLQLTGVVAGLPGRDERKMRFELKVEALESPARAVPFPSYVRLNWYGGAPELSPGDRWRLRVRLKRPHGFLNPGGFDYERWLFQRGIGATGYVRTKGTNGSMGTSHRYAVDRLRAGLGRAIDTALPGHSHAGIVKALAIGDRSGISDLQWEVLRATGTAHLVAISGLHIGLVAGAVFFLTRWLWSLPGFTVLLMAAPRFAAIAAVLAALGYAALAGFSIPTQRALVMVVVVMAGIFFRRNLSPFTSLSWALVLVLVLDPFSVLSAGFWLSFAAVAVILFGTVRRIGEGHGVLRWGRIQWLVAIGLLPLTIATFQQHPIISPFANLLAVPWFGFVLVPLVLVGVLMLLALPLLGAQLLTLGAGGVALIWPMLEKLTALDWVYRGTLSPPLWAVLAAVVGVLVLLLPRGAPARWVGTAWLLPLFVLLPERLPDGAFRLTLLDVGQGLAAVVETREHALVYDAGPRYSERFDAGAGVVVPFLRSRGVERVDAMVLSHGDSDHVGGFESLVNAIPVEQVIRHHHAEGRDAMPCAGGWSWDEVEFAIMHPPPGSQADGNDASCVLRVAGPGGSALLPGDIERGAERQLVSIHGGRLASDILVAPHHGSKTSSTPQFLDAVQARYAVFSSGYRNRFGFPKPEVVERYDARGARHFETSASGAISFLVTPEAGVEGPEIHRREARRFWHHRGSR